MGQLKEFELIKPNLTAAQQSLLNSFYRLSQERRMNESVPLPITDRDIHYYQDNNGSCGYAPDLFIIAIHAIDAEYIKRRCDELRAQANKGR